MMSYPISLKISSSFDIANNSFLALIHAVSKSLNEVGDARSGTSP